MPKNPPKPTPLRVKVAFAVVWPALMAGALIFDPWGNPAGLNLLGQLLVKVFLGGPFTAGIAWLLCQRVFNASGWAAGPQASQPPQSPGLASPHSKPHP